MGLIHVEQATSFVRQKGNPVTMAFAGYGVGRVSKEELLDAIVAYQHDDGGWAQMGADDAYGVSLLTPTLSWCQWLIWMQPAGNKLLQKTTNYLTHTQREGGYWDEPDELLAYDPVP